MDREYLGQLLSEKRKDRKMTQKELSEKSGVHFSHIGAIENGKHNSSIETLEMLLKPLGISLSEFFRELGE